MPNRFNQEWFTFLQTLWVRTGGAIGVNLIGLESQVSAVQGEVNTANTNASAALTDASAAQATAGAAQTTASAAVARAGGVATATVATPTGGTTARTLAAHFADTITPFDFGAAGNGTTDDTAAIRAAIATGRPVFFPAATYLVSGTVAISSIGQHVWGEGQGSLITTNSPTADIFQLSTGGNCIEHLGFGSTVTRTAGAFVNVQAAVFVLLNHLYGSGFYIGIQLSTSTATCSTVRVEHCEMATSTGAGIGYGLFIYNGVDVYISGCLFVGTSAAQLATGIYVAGAGDVTIEHCQCIYAGNAVTIAPAAGVVVQALWFSNCFFDTCSGVGIYVAPAGTVQLLKVHNTWVATCSAGGIVLTVSGSGLVQQTDLFNIVASNHTGFGLNIASTAVTNTKILGGSFSGNTMSGIAIAVNVTLFEIIGATIGATGQFVGNLQYGIVLSAGCDKFTISDNNLLGNTSGSISLGTPGGTAGSTNWIKGNLGFVTQSKGTLITAAGQTTATIAHGLSATPGVNDVRLQFVTTQGAAAYAYPNGWSASSFIINFNAAPGAGIYVAWECRILGT